MSNDLVDLHLQMIRQYVAKLQQQDTAVWPKIDTIFEDLRVIYEEMQTKLEEAVLSEQQLLQQNQHYYHLFQTAPIAYLVTDANGLILEANQAIAQLLNVPQRYLVRKPLSLYVAEADQSNFRTRLNQLAQNQFAQNQFAQNNTAQVWQIQLCSWRNAPFLAHLQIAVNCTAEGRIESLKIGVFNLSQIGQAVSNLPGTAAPVDLLEMAAPFIAQQTLDHTQANSSALPLPHALDGLRVLVVDDEAGIGKFITALLESHGIEVKTVTSSAAALEEIERFQPDVLLSDIRLPGGDGYDLIRQIRALETRQGRHIPAAAITAYLDEDREKALNAGYQAYWYKLAQPTELVEVVVQLAEQATRNQS